jgi:hypothetical protein
MFSSFSLDNCITILPTDLFSNTVWVAINGSSIPVSSTCVMDIFEASKAKIG